MSGNTVGTAVTLAIMGQRVEHSPPLAQRGHSAQCAPLACCIGFGQVLALRAHCVHTAHAEAGILTQEYLSPV